MLTDWIVAAAESQNFPVQSTSIPGVAQRTGATTYHIELVPSPAGKSDKRRPILALAPGVGDVDLVVASELMEAGRAIAGGFVTPDRTTTIASTSRSYLVVEKMAMGDGRYDQQRLLQSVEKNSQEHAAARPRSDRARERRHDQCGDARRHRRRRRAADPGGSVRSGDPRRRQGGRRQSARFPRRLRRGARRRRSLRSDPIKRYQAPAASLADLENEIASMPAPARAFMTEGVRRLAAYQDLAYARLYLDRLGPIRDADAKAGADGQLLAETARHLAVRMSYEDVIRVAQAKIDPARFARIAAQMGIKPDQPFAVTEFLKPGVEEFCSILPPWLARPHPCARRTSRKIRRRPLGHGDQHRVGLRLPALLHSRQAAPLAGRAAGASRKSSARSTSWLKLIARAAPLSAELAIEIAECARLIKGYGDTHKRGSDNYRVIVAQVIEPALAGQMPVRQAADAIASARTAALLDPEGEALSKCLADAVVAAGPRHRRRISFIASRSTPRGLRRLHAQRELGALVGFAERIAGDGRGEAALRADGEPVLVDEARRFFDAFEQIVGRFERGAFRADEAEHDALVRRDETAAARNRRRARCRIRAGNASRR